MMLERVFVFHAFSYQMKVSLKHILVLAAMLLAILWFAWVAYQNRFAINPDGVSYLSIAQHYADGNLSGAINAYWSPLLSWLIVPFIALGYSGQEGFAVVNFGAASFILAFGSFMVLQFTKNYKAMTLYFLSILPFLSSALAAQITPDVLVIAWVLFFVWILTVVDRRLDESRELKKCLKWAVLLGAVGFLGYVTKLYLQPVFLVSIISFAVMTYFLRRRRLKDKKEISRQLVGFTIVTFVSYAFFCLVWIVPMSIKYDSFTLGSSYSYNNGLAAPAGLPQTRMIIPPPHENALTGWEDPTLIDRGEAAASTSMLGALRNRLERVYEAFPDYISNVSNLWVLLFAPILGAGVVLLLRKAYQPQDMQMLHALLVFAIYFSGYTVIANQGNHRYQWPMLVLSILIAALLSGLFWDAMRRSRWARRFSLRSVLSGLLVLLIPFTLFIQYTQYPAEYLRRGMPPTLSLTADKLKEDNVIPAGAKIVSHNFSTVTHLAFYLKAKSYGVVLKTDGQSIDQATQSQLEKYDIDYFIDFTNETSKQYGSRAHATYSLPAPGYCADKSDKKCRMNIVQLR